MALKRSAERPCSGWRYRVLGFALVSMLACGCQRSVSDPQAELQRGQQALRAGDLQEARVYIKNALQANPRLTEGYLALAEIDEQSKKWTSMLANLREALKLEPNHLRAHLKLGQLYLWDRQYDKALEEATTVLQLNPESPDALVLNGAVFFHTNKPADAMIEAEKALAREPANIEASALKSRLLVSEHRHAEAIAVLDQSLAQHPNEPSLQLLKIATKEENQDINGALEDFSKLVAANERRLDLRFGYADLLVRGGKPQVAEQVLRDGVREHPGNLSIKLKLVELLTRNDTAAAERTVNRYLDIEPKQPLLLLALADVYSAQKNYAGAHDVLVKILGLEKSGKNVVLAKARLASLATAQQDFATAERWLNEILQTDAANRDALLQRASIRLGRQEAEAAIADLRIVLRDYPDLDTALILLARAHLQLGAPELAESHFRQALEANPANPAAAYPVAARMVQRHDLERAEEVLNKVLRVSPNDKSALELIAQLKVLRNDLSGADQAVAQLAKKSENVAAANFISGLIFARQGRHEEAIEKYQQALEQRPSMNEALGGMARSYNALEKRAPLLAYLENFVDKHPEVTEALTTLGLVYGVEHRWDDAVRILRAALARNDQAVTTYEILANVYHQQGRQREAAEVYTAGLAKLPDNPILLQGLAEHYEREGNNEAAITAYQRILAKNPQNDRAANNLAAVLADHRNDEASLARASELVERFSNTADTHYLDTYGWVALKAGRVDNALGALTKVVAALPEVPLYRYHLGAAYAQLGENDKAQKELKVAVDLAHRQGTFPELDRATDLLRTLVVPAKATPKPRK